ncbi:hypothetical protein WZ78_08780 [Leuconostoc mesenteroides subsp. dextranicum]|uniref:hypothetical protein n=1 Tax=Leuconostoc mesenteroides TaxID=1245 RepID=UPI000680AC7F|nr:hypothetical protein [Leuconostoc mesenteroides]KMY80851.1 hypothetical protein WZ78_08780 [Leuconostoc mesenteroides subsp. dextranicum]
MNIEDLSDYIKADCSAYKIFIEKALEDQKARNERRPVAKRWDIVKIERQAEKMWANVVTSLHDKLRMESSLKNKEPIYWVKFIADNEILDNFENSMAEFEFE